MSNRNWVKGQKRRQKARGVHSFAELDAAMSKTTGVSQKDRRMAQAAAAKQRKRSEYERMVAEDQRRSQSQRRR